MNKTEQLVSSEDELALQGLKTCAISDSRSPSRSWKEPAPSSAQDGRSKPSTEERTPSFQAQKFRIHTFKETQTAVESKKLPQLKKGKQVYLSSSEC